MGRPVTRPVAGEYDLIKTAVDRADVVKVGRLIGHFRDNRGIRLSQACDFIQLPAILFMFVSPFCDANDHTKNRFCPIPMDGRITDRNRFVIIFT